jgi:hypothetical protein
MDMKHTFGAEIEKELAKIGFDLKGHYPLLKTGIYMLNVDLDQTKVGIWYGPEQEKLATCKLYAEDVARKLAELNEKITARRFDDEAFLQILHKATGGQDHITIPDLVTYLADHDVYGTKTKKTIRTFLSYDLYRLSKRTVDDIEISLVTATRAYTQRKSDFLWVPPSMYISRIKFRKIHPTSSDIRHDIDAAVRR